MLLTSVTYHYNSTYASCSWNLLLGGDIAGSQQHIHGIAVVDAEAQAAAVDAHPQMAVPGEVTDSYNCCSKTRGGADTERPARAEGVRYPAHRRRTDGRAAQRQGQQDRHHTSAHGGFG